MSTVEDSHGATVEATATLTIVDVNRPPVWIDYEEQYSVNENEQLLFSVAGQDPDGDELTIEVFSDDLPEGWEFADSDSGSGEFSWTPTFDDAGEYTVTLILSDGEFDVQIDVPIEVININRAPVVDSPINDIVIVEDEELIVIADLDTVFNDPDGDELVARAVDPPEELRVELNVEDNILSLQPLENFWTDELGLMVVLSATDPVNGIVTDSFYVVVTPVNDLPSLFGLTNPVDSSSIAEYPSVTFSWEESVDQVEGDTVTYALVLSFNEDDHWYRGLDSTSIAISREDFSVDPNLETTLEWTVWAYDGTDSLRCEEPFNLTVAPLSVSKQSALLPIELSLGPIYPNPFNATTTIKYSLPEASKVSIVICDLTGHLVIRLVNSVMPAGYHRSSLNATDLPSGLYFVRLEAAGQMFTQKVMLIR